MLEPVAALFPGQGSQQEGMEQAWVDQPCLQRGLELLDYNPFARLGEGTRYQQPALFLCAVAAWDARQAETGAQEPAAAAGHSLGEYAALVAAGVLSFEDALRVVDVRAEAMDRANEAAPGGMVALLGGTIEDAHALATATGLAIANDNAPGQVVLSGPLHGIEQAEAMARDYETRARRLPVSAAFHTPLMAPAADALAAALADVTVDSASFPVISNGSVQPFVDVRRELVENLLSCVRFRETLLALHEQGIERFDEIGPGRVLAGLVRRTMSRRADAVPA